MFGIGGIKSYLYIGLAGLVLTLGIMFFTWFKGIQAEVGNLREANAEYSIQVNALEAQKENDTIVIESMKLAMETQAEALAIVNDQFGEIRDIREKEQRVLDGSRLGRLAAERAGRMESLSNAATSKKMAEFEGVINEDF